MCHFSQSLVFTNIIGSFHDLRRRLVDEEKPNGSTRLAIGDVIYNDIVTGLDSLISSSTILTFVDK